MQQFSEARAIVDGQDADDATALAGFQCLPVAGNHETHVMTMTAMFDALCLGDPPRTTLQARLTVLPPESGKASTVAATLLVGVERESERGAGRFARDLTADLLRLHDRDSGFRLRLLAGSEVHQAIAPFDVVDGAEIGVRQEPLGRIGERVLACPMWHLPVRRDWMTLVRCLIRLQTPVTVAMNLRPTRIAPDEREFLEDLMRLQSTGGRRWRR